MNFLSNFWLLTFLISYNISILLGRVKKNCEKAFRLTKTVDPLPPFGQLLVKISWQVVIFVIILPFYKGITWVKIFRNSVTLYDQLHIYRLLTHLTGYNVLLIWPVRIWRWAHCTSAVSAWTVTSPSSNLLTIAIIWTPGEHPAYFEMISDTHHKTIIQPSSNYHQTFWLPLLYEHKVIALKWFPIPWHFEYYPV